MNPSVWTLSFLKSRLSAKSRLFKVKFHFGHKISFLKSRFLKSILYCSTYESVTSGVSPRFVAFCGVDSERARRDRNPE